MEPLADDEAPPRHRVSSRVRLTPRSLPQFPGDTLFARVARALCAAGCLPRKELYESWEMARRVRRRFRGGRVVDLACGHGLLAHLLLILDDTSPAALAVDARLPPCAARVAEVLAAGWPRLAGRIELREASLDRVPLHADDLVVSAHACGSLTDAVLDRAIAARARVAVLPCCTHLVTERRDDLAGWLEGALAIDVARAMRLRAAGYAIHTLQIPEEITPKNRLLLGEPRATRGEG